MTPAQQAQIDQCKRMWSEGATPDDMRALGFASAAINAAMRSDPESLSPYGVNTPPAQEAAQ